MANVIEKRINILRNLEMEIEEITGPVQGEELMVLKKVESDINVFIENLFELRKATNEFSLMGFNGAMSEVPTVITKNMESSILNTAVKHSIEFEEYVINEVNEFLGEEKLSRFEG